MTCISDGDKLSFSAVKPRPSPLGALFEYPRGAHSEGRGCKACVTNISALHESIATGKMMPQMKTHTKTLRVRIRDKHAKVLSQWAYEVNQVWNAANEQSAEYSWVPIPGVGYVHCGTSEFELNNELKGIRAERDLSIGAATVQSVIAQHAKSRRQFKKSKLNWRCSGGSKRALGWIPFKTAGVKLVNGQIRFCGRFFKVWDSYDLSKFELGTGSFSEDARGRWYFNTIVKVENKLSDGRQPVGIDLGLSAVATTSVSLIAVVDRTTGS